MTNDIGDVERSNKMKNSDSEDEVETVSLLNDQTAILHAQEELMDTSDHNGASSDPASPASVDAEEEDDPYKPEATLRLDIDHFSEFAKGTSETHQRLSKPVYVRGLPWKILAMPRETSRSDRRMSRTFGFFLQCNGESDAISWSCTASAVLTVLSQKPGVENHVRKINHTFYQKENDWGYSQFLTCDVSFHTFV
ncbi:hypothetical protein AB6A40_007074 [Gnathostoma spinigerum]|uniref:MATH domain-containing protein n=1 Tax=Gnathostoma spinigerum TaxID=75299 RepID=A0ABD6ELE2_9BILA